MASRVSKRLPIYHSARVLPSALARLRPGFRRKGERVTGNDGGQHLEIGARNVRGLELPTSPGMGVACAEEAGKQGTGVKRALVEILLHNQSLSFT